MSGRGPSTALAPGMVGGVELPQALPRDVRVNLCRGDILVPEEHLNRSQIGPVLKQVGREGMAQLVR